MNTSNNAWAKMYEGIERANMGIKDIEDTYNNDISTASRDLQHLYGELLTLRGMIYYDLVKAWGDVPYRFEPVTSETLYLGRTSRVIILQKVIEDLKVAKKWIYEVGLKSFGLKNYYSNNNRINWFLEDAQTCMNKMIDSYKNETKYENKIDFYDLIINEVNDIIPKEYCSPPVSNFTDEFLGNIKLLLKKNGVFIVNIQTRNFKVLYENYKQIDKYFPTCCVIPSESSLCYIFICFNQILSEESYSERFQINKEKILKGNVIDSNLVEPFYRDVISKIKSVKEEIKKMEDNSKKI
jgi:hypothetical protein